MFGRYFKSKPFVAATTQQVRRLFNAKDPLDRANIPVYGAMVGVTALCFQIAVLYPWHHELSEQFEEIQVSACALLCACPLLLA